MRLEKQTAQQCRQEALVVRRKWEGRDDMEMRAEGRRGRTGPGGAMTESYFSRNADNSSQNALPKNPGSWIVPSVGRGKEI